MSSTIPKYRKLSDEEAGNGKKYELQEEIRYTSSRYDNAITVPIGYRSDGATWAMDIQSASWWVHDKMCDDGKWDDGTLCTNWQASYVVSDILWREWSWRKPLRGIRAILWRPATFLFGGGKARENGMF